jgi:DNA-binding transcriptional regulator YhcF (GntR family)
VVQALVQALRHLVSLVEDLSLRHVTARVAKILLDQEVASQGELHGYRLTQQEMAALAGTAREVVGRALKELETAGAIQMRQGHAVVVNHERLHMLSSGELEKHVTQSAPASVQTTDLPGVLPRQACIGSQRAHLLAPARGVWLL